MLDVHSRVHKVKKTIVRDTTSTKPQPFDPIPPIASSIAEETWLLCFDEFQVDIHMSFSRKEAPIVKYINKNNYIAGDGYRGRYDIETAIHRTF